METLYFNLLSYFSDDNFLGIGGNCFANAPCLKEIFVARLNPFGVSIHKDAFANVTSDVNIYFFNYTFEEVMALCDNAEWYTNASEKAHFYFKDTMPDDVQIPDPPDNVPDDDKTKN